MFGIFRRLPPALRARHKSPPTCRVAYATEMTRGRPGLNVAIRKFQDASRLTINWCGNIRPNARASFQPSVLGNATGHENPTK